MSFKILFSDGYEKKACQFFKKHPDLIEKYAKTLRVLQANPQHPSLRLHPLKGKLKGLHSVSINMSYRITLELMITDKEIILISVGSHDQAYQN